MFPAFVATAAARMTKYRAPAEAEPRRDRGGVAPRGVELPRLHREERDADRPDEEPPALGDVRADPRARRTGRQRPREAREVADELPGPVVGDEEVEQEREGDDVGERA